MDGPAALRIFSERRPTPLRESSNSNLRAYLLQLARTRGGMKLPGRGDRTFGENVLVLVGGTAAGQALVLLASPILTRVYDPAAFGVHGIYASLLLMALSFAAFRYETAIPVAPDEHTAAELLALSILAVVVSAAVAGLLVWILGPAIDTWGTLAMLGPFAWLLPLGIVFGGLYQVLNYWMVRQGAFGLIARTRAGQSFGQALWQILLGFLGLGALGLIAGEIVGRSGGAARLGWGARADVKRSGTKITTHGIIAAARRYRRFPLISAPSAAINTAGIRVPALMLAVIFPAGIVGWFALAQRIIAVPLSLIGQSVAQVYFREGSRRAREEPDTLLHFFEHHTRRLALLAIAPAVVLGASAPVVFPLIFGDSWREAGIFAALLAPLLYAQLSVSPLSQTALVIDRQDLQLRWDSARLTVLVAMFGIVWAFDLSARWAVGLYSLSMTLMYVVLLKLYRSALSEFVRKIQHE